MSRLWRGTHSFGGCYVAQGGVRDRNMMVDEFERKVK